MRKIDPIKLFVVPAIVTLIATITALTLFVKPARFKDEKPSPRPRYHKPVEDFSHRKEVLPRQNNKVLEPGQNNVDVLESKTEIQLKKAFYMSEMSRLNSPSYGSLSKYKGNSLANRKETLRVINKYLEDQQFRPFQGRPASSKETIMANIERAENFFNRNMNLPPSDFIRSMKLELRSMLQWHDLGSNGLGSQPIGVPGR